MSSDLKELAQAVEAAASKMQASNHWAGFYARMVGPSGDVYEEVAELASVSVVIDDLLTDLDARDREVARWRQWAARYFERCEEAAPDEYESIRNEIMEMCRPYAERGENG